MMTFIGSLKRCVYVIAACLTAAIILSACGSAGDGNKNYVVCPSDCLTYVRPANVEYYYWDEDQKISLNRLEKKHYILFETAAQETVAKTLGLESSDISSCNASGYISNGSDIVLSETYSFAIVTGLTDNELNNIAEIIYYAPYVTYNGPHDMGISNLLLVNLRHEKDLDILRAYAAANDAFFVNDSDLPRLWHTIFCTINSSGNAMELSNFLHETGRFVSAQPDFAGMFYPCD